MGNSVLLDTEHYESSIRKLNEERQLFEQEMEKVKEKLRAAEKR